MANVGIMAKNTYSEINSQHVMFVDANATTHRVRVYFSDGPNGKTVKEIECSNADEMRGVLQLFSRAFDADAGIFDETVEVTDEPR